MGKYFCYRHIRNDLNVPFYIGIGTKPKEFDFEKKEYRRAFVTTKKSKRSDFWINTYLSCNKDINVEILFESDDQKEIKEKEIEFIKLHGRRNLGLGPLCNLTDGGDGTLNFVVTEERKEVLRKQMIGNKYGVGSTASRGRICKESTKLKISLANAGKQTWLGKKHKKETLEKLSKAKKGNKFWVGKTHSDESKLKNSISQLNQSDETRKKRSISQTGNKHSEETRKKISLALIGNKRNLGKRASEETKRKMSESHKRLNK